MKYRSTRGKVEATSFEDVLFSGYASDGGLFMPESIPVVDKAILEKWRGLSYLELTKEVMSLFIPSEEISTEDLNDLINKAFSEFGHRDLLSIAKVNNFHVLELFHGKTLAFKDYALVSVGMFMDFFLKKKKKNTIVLVGTSGDTGSAAIESVRRSEWIDIIVLFPKGRANQMQELQMTTVTDSNVHVFSTEGTSDDLDKPIKNCFSDHEYAETNHLSSINSINWCRIMAQLVHIFYAYFQVCQEVGDTVKFIIPTGALGHCTAGLLVHKMGLPVELVCAVNENDIVHRAVSTGVFSMSEVVQQTWSTAMDIQVPYNFERLLLLSSDMNYALVDSLMQEFEQNNSLKMPEDLRNKMSKVISSASVSCDQTLQTMKECWDENQYLLCPHTAVAVAVAWDQRHLSELKTPTVCMATASPAKFPEAVKAAGIEMPMSPQLAQLLTRSTRCKEMKAGEDWDQMLRATIDEISKKRSKPLKFSSA
ncbi:unnamed protein product [Porites evermanni]|uniref:Threonine synthase-like 2 n=1 Tax=Porites evermanni TaxID=104178 RepID=A0ABN8RDE0_9CNID|nr:unnamed protein product [Porites evermanni]